MAILKLGQIFNDNKVSPCHGIEHAKIVMDHSRRALQFYDISDEDKLLVEYAALLHDFDDRKFFPSHLNYDNLRQVLSTKSGDFVDKVIYMVSIVSSSKNGDSIPLNVYGKEWMLIPRYADRIEAIGIIGIERCYTYTKNVSKNHYICWKQ